MEEIHLCLMCFKLWTEPPYLEQCPECDNDANIVSIPKKLSLLLYIGKLSVKDDGAMYSAVDDYKAFVRLEQEAEKYNKLKNEEA